MNKQEHRPLPWKSGDNYIADRDAVCVIEGCDLDYIVRACNAFPDLVEALEELSEFYANICAEHGMSQWQINDDELFCQVQAALRAAKGAK